jgi:hypothetical protein
MQMSEKRIPYKPDAYVLQVRRMIAEVSDWVATHTNVVLNTEPHNELVGILMRHADELREQQATDAARGDE